MATIDAVYALKRAGRFGEALRQLNLLRGLEAQKPAMQVLRCELLQLTGDIQQSRVLGHHLLDKPKRLSVAEQSTCEYVLGRAGREEGYVNAVIEHLQRSVSLARQAGDLSAMCQAQLALLAVLADLDGPDAVGPMASEIRANVTRLGDPHTTASLHIHVSELEAKRGHFYNARRHADLALAILSSEPNCWLQARAEHLLFAVDLLKSDLELGNARGLRALKLAEQSEHAAMCRNCLGNLGNYYYFVGDYDRAKECFERSLSIIHADGTQNNANVESLARLSLTQGRLSDCAAFIERVIGSVRSADDRQLYINRHSELTKAALDARAGNVEEALARTNFVLELAARIGDTPLANAAGLMKVELLVQAGRLNEASEPLLHTATPCRMFEAPDIYVNYERVLGLAAAAHGDHAAEIAHYDRGLRFACALHNVPLKAEFERCWPERAPRKALQTPVSAARAVLHGLTALTLNPNRLEFVACELVAILGLTGCAHTAAATASSGSAIETLEADGDSSPAHENAPIRTVTIGRVHERDISITVRPRADIESLATLNAAIGFVSAMRDLAQGRTDREERATLWPIEELPLEGDSSIISGHMRELMTYARKIARVKVNVLITGESGTGKEILARAIHNFSDRAQKPFVPFNCTAVPRDLLESQLFGHRRGAFTGADRDQLGTIRTAREGTLFLDEIGELGLDLQPKLLRFLESGEIAPLGDPEPKTIDVRVIAATNANLEDAVRAGRFREDLFYRLNVVRLSLRPLRERRDEIPGFVHHFVQRAAEEFHKGRITVAEETMERLILYRWPGNVRQLQNEVRRLVALAEPQSTIGPDAIDEAILGAMPVFHRPILNGAEVAVPLKAKLLPTLARIECEMVKTALKENGGRVNAAAKALGISRKGLYLKRQRFGL